jgi:uncharacterized protein (TIGR02231 family)
METRGQIESVTVYRGEALVSRLIDVPAAENGLAEIVVTDLPERIQPGSLHAESDGGLTVRSVRYRTRPVSQDMREEVRVADDKIEKVQQALAANKRHTELAAESKAYLDNLQKFSAPTANAELTRGVLNAETLERLTKFILEQREKIAGQELDLANEAKKLGAELDLAQREKQHLTAGSARTIREAVVFVGMNAKNARGGSVHLRYLVDGATWDPSYNARAFGMKQGSEAAGAAGGRQGERQDGKPDGKQNGGQQVALDYFASVQQMSGEDWTNVAMTLSTATPSLAATAPTITPLRISLAAPTAPQSAATFAEYRQQREELSKQVRRAESARVLNSAVAGQILGDREADKTALAFTNEAAASLDLFDLSAGVNISNRRDARRAAADEGISVTYSLPNTVTLPSRNDRQLVQIASLALPATFSKTATPLLTSYVYDEAKVTNSGTLVLLSGPLTAYAEGTFVGSGAIPTVAAGQSFVVGFGIDSSLRAERELLERTDTTQGGNRIVEITYRLSIENFGTQPTTLRLFDRTPKPGSQDVRVTLVSTGRDLSLDDDYAKTQKKEGILRWDLAVPPTAAGAPMEIEYKFRLEFDKQMGLAGM